MSSPEAVSTPNPSSQKDGSDALFHGHKRLLEWTIALGGYLHPDVRLAQSLSKGYYMVVAAGKEIKAGTRIVSCPIGATMSVLNALDIEPFQAHGTKFPKAFLKDHVNQPEIVQAFYLMDQYVRGEDSWWWPYIETLPSVEAVGSMQFDSAEDAVWLEGTNLKSGFNAQNTKWQDLYTKGLRSLKVTGWPAAMNGKYSWELYRWAATMFGSRSFTSSVLDDTRPADQARMSGRSGVPQCSVAVKELFTEKFAVLLPMLDILNHWPATPVEWQARSTFVGMQVLEPFESGQELCNNYGPKDNEGLLLSYGFVIPENPFDHVVIDLRVPPSSPLDEARSQWARDERSHFEFKSFILHPDHPSATAPWLESVCFSYDLIDGISVLVGNDRELETMCRMKKTLMSACLGRHKAFDDNRNMLASLSQLLRDCRARVKRLEDTYPTIAPRDDKQRAAKTYRDGQLSIVRTACIISNFVLLRASRDWNEEKLLAKVEVDYNGTTTERLRRALKSHRCATSPAELLSIGQLLEMFPDYAASKIKERIAKIEQSLSAVEAKNAVPTELSLTKTRFAVVLAAANVEYETGTKLPSRLRCWLEQLRQWYPPNDPNWIYVPPPGPWAPGEEPPPALMTLLKAREDLVTTSSDGSASNGIGHRSRGHSGDPSTQPEMLCWGWNVMEEEGVLLPADLLEDNQENRDVRKDEFTFMLYCKTY